MKKIIAILTLVSLAVLGSSGNAIKYENYYNGRFEYSVDFPDIFHKYREPDNGDGIIFQSKDEKVILTISGGYNVMEEDGNSQLDYAYEDAAYVVPGSDKSGKGFYTITYRPKEGVIGNLTYVYGIINEGAWAAIYLSYPESQEAQFAPIKERMRKTLKLPQY
ncbi:MAG: hypothetical protein LBQ96_09075 [Fusobacteriaceae bacterium]|jgi:hypothetical protein|nr:hypothetical protein [Fusobacteriaceae bacterium]